MQDLRRGRVLQAIAKPDQQRGDDAQRQVGSGQQQKSGTEQAQRNHLDRRRAVAQQQRARTARSEYASKIDQADLEADVMSVDAEVGGCVRGDRAKCQRDERGNDLDQGGRDQCLAQAGLIAGDLRLKHRRLLGSGRCFQALNLGRFLLRCNIKCKCLHFGIRVSVFAKSLPFQMIRGALS